MSRPLSLLIAGLTMPATKRLNPQLDVVKFGDTLDKSIQSLDKIRGLYYQRFDLDHDAPSDSPESLASLQKTIKQGPPQGGEWDAYLYTISCPGCVQDELIPSLALEQDSGSFHL